MCRHAVPRICERLDLSADRHKIDCGSAQRLRKLDPRTCRA
jgi:hypothetical protein